MPAHACPIVCRGTYGVVVVGRKRVSFPRVPLCLTKSVQKGRPCLRDSAPRFSVLNKKNSREFLMYFAPSGKPEGSTVLRGDSIFSVFVEKAKKKFLLNGEGLETFLLLLACLARMFLTHLLRNAAEKSMFG